MAQKIEAGRYEARIVNYGIGTTKAGNPQVMVLFEFEDKDQDRHEITWYGTLKEGRGQEITIDSLLVMGMVGNDLTALADGVESGLLNVDSPVNITVALETTEQGQTFAKVQWVNALGGKAFRDKLSKNEAQVKLGALNLKGAVMSRRKETGIQDTGQTYKKASGGFDSYNPAEEDDLPF